MHNITEAAVAVKAARTPQGYRYTGTAAIRERRRLIQAKAHRAMRAALAEGRIPPAATQVCADCGGSADVWHHPDYRKPLTLTPLCDPCHARQPMAKPWAPPVTKQDPIADRMRPFVVWLSRKELHDIKKARRYQQSVEAFIRRAAIVHASHGDPSEMRWKLHALQELVEAKSLAPVLTPELERALFVLSDTIATIKSKRLAHKLATTEAA
jgi:hypothetical protein